MKILYLIAILSVTLYSNAEVNKIFTIIYASGNNVLFVNSDSPKEVKYLFPSAHQKVVTALSIHGDDFYEISISEVRPHYSLMNRCKIIRSLQNGEIVHLDGTECPETRWTFNGKATPFVVAREKIYFDDKNNFYVEGDSDFDIKFNATITGIAFNPADDHFYASSKSGDLLYGNLRNNESFSKISFEFKEATTVKVALNKVWVGFLKKDNYTEKMNSVLFKCSFNYTDVNSAFSQKDCEIFHQYDYSYGKIMHIGATHDYLFINLKKSTKMSRCDPNQIGSCKDDFIKPRNMTGPFVIDLPN